MKAPLIAPAASVAAGILLSRVAPFQVGELGAAGCAFFLLAVAAWWAGRRKEAKRLAAAGAAEGGAVSGAAVGFPGGRVAGFGEPAAAGRSGPVAARVTSHGVIALVCVSLGFVAVGALTALWHRMPPPLKLDVEGREVVILGGCVVDPPTVSGDRERFILELEPHARAQVTLYTRDGETLPTLHYGQNIEAEVRVRPPRNFGNPGAFDYERYLYRQEIYWTASGAAGTVRVLPGRCGSRFQAALMGLREAGARNIERLYGRGYNAGMLQAILLGQSYQLQRVWTQDYRSTGTFHALVISGTHIAVLSVFFMFLLRLCFVPESVAFALTVAAAWLYAMVTGWQAPCVRSAAGLTLYMLGGYFYRQRRALNMIAAVALGFLLFDPEQLLDASFQLTFLAVTFLAAFAAPAIRATSGPLMGGLRDLEDVARDVRLEPRVAQFRVEMRLLISAARGGLRLPAGLARAVVEWPARLALFGYELLVTSAAAQLGLALPMVIYFHRLGVSGLSANMIVVPLMGLVVPLGFVAMVTGLWPVAKLVGLLLWVSQRVVEWHAAMEPNWRIPTPPGWLCVALAAALALAALCRARWQRWAMAGVVAGLLALLVWHPFPPQLFPGQLEMSVIDVGQGDSVFVAFPQGQRMLVDGGGIPSFAGQARSRMDIGEDVVAPYLWNRGIRRLDVIVATHAHEDHVGGLPALISNFRPRELWTGAMAQGPVWNAVREAAVRNGVKIVPRLAPAAMQFGGAQLEILAPLPNYALGEAAKNNDSLVMRVSFGRHTFLLTGDAERQIEWSMLAAGERLRADVMKAPHHGSRTSSTDEFLNAVNPTFALISAGYLNSYGNPHPDVLERLAARGTLALRTDEDGLLCAHTDGRHLHIETGRSLGGAGASPAMGQ